MVLMINTTKGTKIEGLARITDRGTTQTRGCSLETPYLNLEINGAKYRWISDGAAEFAFSSVEAIRVTAFARNNGRLYRVQVTK